ncbi:MAG: hypothetical protein KDD40_07555 [Bdellovibrionales bacterium]|nr:hypothetical protein [Bdellovibrionales bacterium]
MLKDYLEIMDQASKQLQLRGVDIKAYNSPTVFESLNSKDTAEAMSRAKNYLEWAQPLDKKLHSNPLGELSHELRNNDLALDAALTCAFQGFEMDYKAFPKLVDKGDVIDAYTLDFKQIYCNENFFKNTSYTLDQLSSISIFVLFKRPAKIEAELKRACIKAITEHKPVVLNMDKYLMSETKSRSGYWLEAKHKCILPIFNVRNHQPEGVISVIKVNKFRY